MIRTIFVSLLMILSGGIAFAQVPTQTVRGTVIDADTHLPLIGASVTVMKSKPLKGTSTNTEGEFRLENVPVGRVDLQVSYLGYQDRIIPNVEVKSAKEVVLNLRLVESTVEMEEVVVAPAEEKGNAINDLAIISSRSVSAEQTSRYAGGFNDPAKITSNFAGVATTQDGGNEIIVRGNSPKYIQWRLEGSEISNPNHFGDQNAISGIVSALNNNLLSTSDFYTGAFPAEFGSALSGVYDIRMRRGNNEQFEGIFGLGILGTDVTAEGPFKEGYGGSYLVNFRYSTIGLVTDLGLTDVEGASLNFQDAAFKIWLPTKNMGIFSIFGIQGTSNFLFEDVDPGIWVTPGEDFAQASITEDYKKGALLFNTGLNHTVNLSPQSYLQTTLMYSREGIEDEVFENLNASNSANDRRLNFNTDARKAAYQVSSDYHYKINSHHKLKSGVHYTVFDQNMIQSQLDEQEERFSLVDFNEQLGSLQSFVNWKFTPNDNISLVAGLHNTSVFFNDKYTLEPRFAVSYSLAASSKLSFGYGNHSTMESVHNYYARVRQEDGTFTTPNLDLGLLRANHFVAGYEKYFGRNLRLKLETYYQHLYNIPVENDENSSYSTLNEDLELNYVDLVNEGTGKNYGVELTIERFFNEGYYFLFNTSLYESKYRALDGVERNTKYNGKYLVNVLAGKEFTGLGKKENQVLAVNIKAFLGGGRYIIPLYRDENGGIDVDAGSDRIYDYSRAYKRKLDDIVSVIASVSYKWNKLSTTHELYLNIDNLTNNRARLNEFYDASATDYIGYERQVAIIPNLLYRIYF